LRYTPGYEQVGIDVLGTIQIFIERVLARSEELKKETTRIKAERDQFKRAYDKIAEPVFAVLGNYCIEHPDNTPLEEMDIYNILSVFIDKLYEDHDDKFLTMKAERDQYKQEFESIFNYIETLAPVEMPVQMTSREIIEMHLKIKKELKAERDRLQREVTRNEGVIEHNHLLSKRVDEAEIREKRYKRAIGEIRACLEEPPVLVDADGYHLIHARDIEKIVDRATKKEASE
jgi:hypothetical protein